MSAAELRAVWFCEDCKVRCYKMGGEAFPRPEGWVGDKCLRCAREDEEPHDKARRLLAEGKAPSRVCVKGVSKKWMRETQQELIEAGELDPERVERQTRTSKPKSPDEAPEKQQQAEAVLKEDPELSNQEIARRASVAKGTVAKARARMGLPDYKVLRRAKVKALIEAEPSLKYAEVRDRTGRPVTRKVLREVREELAATPA
jgi:hypothetical protein